VCKHCLEEAPPVNGDGKRISYSNVSLDGGIQSQIEGSTVLWQDSDCEAVCYVKGRQCRAEEGRFGGIVIQAVSYRLLGPDGFYESETPGLLGGNSQPKQGLYGRLDCSSAVRAVKSGDNYKKYRVFFADEATAVACGYRPCFNCMRAEYEAWKAEQVDAGA